MVSRSAETVDRTAPTHDVCAMLRKLHPTYTSSGGFLASVGPFVDATWDDAVMRRRIQESMRLVLPTDLRETADWVVEHMRHRVPVNYGSPSVNVDYDEAEYRHLSGISTTDVVAFRDRLARATNIEAAKLRYALLAWTPCVPNAHSPLVNPSSGCWVAHLWGVDTNNEDGFDAMFVHGNIRKYLILLDRMFSILEGTVKTLRVHEGRRDTSHPVVLRITGLGMGVWATGIHAMNQFDHVKDRYMEHLTRLAVKHGSWLQIRHPQHPHGRTIAAGFGVDAPKGQWVKVGDTDDPFGGGVSEAPLPENADLLIANAWDGGSFPGNGASKDNSHDGWMVAGGSRGFHPSRVGDGSQTLGHQLQNASYLHGHWFHPELLQTQRLWRYI